MRFSIENHFCRVRQKTSEMLSIKLEMDLLIISRSCRQVWFKSFFENSLESFDNLYQSRFVTLQIRNLYSIAKNTEKFQRKSFYSENDS